MKASEPHCIVCGKKLRTETGIVGRTAGAVLMGLSLSGCPADDSTGETMAGTESAGSTGTASSSSMSASSASTDPSTTDATDASDASTFGSEAAYGVPGTGTTMEETETSADTDTDTDTDTDGETTNGSTGADTGSTSVSPDYGVPDTSP